jgi:transcriptional regulator with XRE-family HTH domain
MNEETLQKIKLQIAHNIKSFMKDAKKSQKELADYLGVHESTVSLWLRGTNSIDMGFLLKICEFLGLSLNDVYGVTENPPEFILTEEEASLLLNYRRLSKENKTKIQGFIEMAKE